MSFCSILLERPNGVKMEKKLCFSIKPCIIYFILLCTVDENINAAIKMRNNFCNPLKKVIFPILLSQYWTFLYCSPFSYQSSYLLSFLISLLKFLYEFCILVHGFFSVLLPIQLSLSNYCDSNSCRSFTLLAKSNSNVITITFKSDKERQLSLSRWLEERLLQKGSLQKRSKELKPKRMQ